MKISKVLPEITKKDLSYCLVILLVILIASLTFWLGGKGNDIVSHLGFAGTLASIIIAVIAIFYTLIQGTITQQNIGQMQGIMDKVDDTIKNLSISTQSLHTKVSAIETKQDEVIETLDQRGQFKESPSATAPTSHQESYQLEKVSNSGLLALYWAAKTLDSPRASSPKIFAEVIDYPNPDYAFGFIMGFNCFLEDKGGEILVDRDTLKAKKLPDGFSEAVKNEFDRRIPILSKDEKHKGALQFIKTSQEKINTYFLE